MTLDCVGLTQSNVIIYSKRLLLSLVFSYIFISQDSVEIHFMVWWDI